jgi:antitoxin (DNA-binding transcriptional repressor) of toxin-antitoxin stability system
MTRVTASEARQEFFRLLDAVEQGESVVVERKGVRFQVSMVPREPAERSASPVVVKDPEVLTGNWTWTGDKTGQLQFRARRQGR